MSRLFTVTSALALALAAAAPAIAQQADPMAQPSAPITAQSETVQAPTAVEPSSQPMTTAPTATPAPEATAAVTQESQVTALVETEFPSYDADKTGELSRSEFSTWVLALQAKASEVDVNAKKMDDAAKAKWAKDAFASADTDKSKKISKAEVVKFLLG